MKGRRKEFLNLKRFGVSRARRGGKVVNHKMGRRTQGSRELIKEKSPSG